LSFFRASSERQISEATARQQQHQHQHQHQQQKQQQQQQPMTVMTSRMQPGRLSTATVDGLSTIAAACEGTPLLLMPIRKKVSQRTTAAVECPTRKVANETTTDRPTSKKKSAAKTRAYKKYGRSTSVSLPVAQPALSLPKTATSIAVDEGVVTAARVGEEKASQRYLRVSDDCIQLIEVGQPEDDNDDGPRRADERLSQSLTMTVPEPGVNTEQPPTGSIPRIHREATVPLIGGGATGSWIQRSSLGVSPDRVTASNLPCDSAFWSNFDLRETAAAAAAVGESGCGRQQQLVLLMQTPGATSPPSVAVNAAASARRRILKKNFGRTSSSTPVCRRASPQEIASPVKDTQMTFGSPEGRDPRPPLRKSSTLTSKFWSTSLESAPAPSLKVRTSKSSAELQHCQSTAAVSTASAMAEKPFFAVRRSKFPSLGNVQSAWHRKRRTTAPPTSLQLLPTSSSLLSTSLPRPATGDGQEISPSLSRQCIGAQRSIAMPRPFKDRTVSTTAVCGDDADEIGSDALSDVTSLTGSLSTVSSPTGGNTSHQWTSSTMAGGCVNVYGRARCPIAGRRTADGRSVVADGRSSRVRINVSGQRFETKMFVLDRHPTTLLGDSVRRRRFYDVDRRELFFDRHRPSFEAIFTYLQTGGRLRRPYHVPDDVFLAELEFYELEADVVDEYKRSEGYTFEVGHSVRLSNFKKRTPHLCTYVMRRKPVSPTNSSHASKNLMNSDD
jgi:hypothetical protein